MMSPHRPDPSRCRRPHCRGRYQLEASSAGHWSRSTYTLACDQCGRRCHEIAGYPLAEWLAADALTSRRDEHAVRRWDTQFDGLAPGYLLWCGLTSTMLRWAWIHSGWGGVYLFWDPGARNGAGALLTRGAA